MTLADLIQSQMNKDIEKLEAQYKADLKENKDTWNTALSETKKLHTEKIEEAVATQVNFQKFQNSKTSKFNSGYAIQSQLEVIYIESLPEILASNFVKTLIQDTLQGIPQNTTLTITGKYTEELKDIISSLGYKNSKSNQNSNLGAINGKLENISLEITVEDILDKVKKTTLASVIKEI
jgi:hypothetical protein